MGPAPSLYVTLLRPAARALFTAFASEGLPGELRRATASAWPECDGVRGEGG